MSEAVWAAYRRTVELGDQLEASVVPDRRPGARQPVTDRRSGPGATLADAPVDLRHAPLATVRAVRPPRRGARPVGRRGGAVGSADDQLGRASTMPPGTSRAPRRPTPAAPDWSLAEHVGHIADWQELAEDYTARALETGVWPSDSDYDDGDFDRYNERRREPWASMPRDDILGQARGRAPGARSGSPGGCRPRRSARRGPWGWVYNTLHGHYLDHLAVIEPWTGTLRLRQVDGDPFVADPRAADAADFAAQEAAIAADFDRLVRPIPPDAGGGRRDARLGPRRPRDAPRRLGRRGRARAGDPCAGGHLAGRPGRRHRCLERPDGRPPSGRPGGWPSSSATTGRGPRCWTPSRTLPAADLRSPDGWSWAYDCLHGHVRKHLAMLGPWCVEAARPGRDG